MEGIIADDWHARGKGWKEPDSEARVFAAMCITPTCENPAMGREKAFPAGCEARKAPDIGETSGAGLSEGIIGG